MGFLYREPPMDVQNKSENLPLHAEGRAEVVKSAKAAEAVHAAGVYHAVCIGPREEDRAAYAVIRDQILECRRNWLTKALNVFKLAKLEAELALFPLEEKWRDVAYNLVTTVGGNDILDKYLAGSTYTATPKMGLKGTGTAVIGDTQASHASWLEQGLANAPVYTGNRPTPAFSAAAAKVKATSAAVNFAFTSGGTVFGCFINNGGSATKDDTTGILVSAGDFSGGSKVVANTDQLNVTYSLGV